MAPETIIELLLVSVQAGIGPGQAVHLASQPVLHVALVVEVGHVPSVLLVIVVVGIGAVVTGSNTLSIRSRSSVVEICSSLVTHLSSWP